MSLRPGHDQAPLDQLTSIRTKLGALVAASVVVAAAVATVGGRAGVAPWLALPITVALALAVTQLLAVGMTSPLGEMTRAATRMAGGHYDVRVRSESADEVGQLARAFNQMASDLGEVDQRRRDLVSTVSHELRTPLAGLIAVLENLEDGVTPAGPAGLRTALSQAERLSALVGDLLDLARLEAGAAPVVRTPVALRALLDTAVAEARSLAREVSYEVVLDPPDLTVEADAARLHQLVANLLDNASRHSPSGGTVHVAATRDGADWVLEVANAGDPIPSEARERVFARFGTTDRTGGGTGLGLSIARWVTDLHGGSIAAVDPLPGHDGARLRAVLPLGCPPEVAPTTPSTSVPPKEISMTTTPPELAPPRVSAPTVPPHAPGSGLLSWPSGAAPARPWLLLGSGLVGLLAALVLVDQRPGLGYVLVLLAGGGVVLAAQGRRRDPFTLTCALLAAALVSVLALREALWLATLCCLAATALVLVGSTRARSVTGVLLSGLVWPFSAIAGLPWLGRTIRAISGTGRTLLVIRTAALSLAGLVVFGLLFASADAVFADWFTAVVPDVSIDGAVVRIFVGLAVAGLVLATAYFSLHPPRVEPDVAAARRPTRHRWEWLAPVLVVDGVFVVFLVSQAAAIFGGHGFVERATGLTYADYVHQGFAQLTVATLLTVLVVSVASRKAAVATPTDRAWLRGSLGVLCALTLLVVGSALHRLHLYTEVYGLTRLRLVAGTFELWLGVLVVGLLVAGIGLHGAWLTRGVVLSGAGALLLLALVNPDGLVARTNVERFAGTGRIDLSYLSGLSGDATPELMALPDAQRGCVLASRAAREPTTSSFWEANLARSREHDDLAAVRRLPQGPCPYDSRGYVGP